MIQYGSGDHRKKKQQYFVKIMKNTSQKAHKKAKKIHRINENQK